MLCLSFSTLRQFLSCPALTLTLFASDLGGFYEPSAQDQAAYYGQAPPAQQFYAPNAAGYAQYPPPQTYPPQGYYNPQQAQAPGGMFASLSLHFVLIASYSCSFCE